jgi:hypothetical protein
MHLLKTGVYYDIDLAIQFILYAAYGLVIGLREDTGKPPASIVPYLLTPEHQIPDELF